MRYPRAKEFFDPWFFSMCQQEFDAARRHLKTCGKPVTEYDRWLIAEAKWSARYYGGLLSM